jgi:hypothetical protein
MDYKVEHLAEVKYKLPDRIDAKYINTQDTSCTTLHRRCEINARETHLMGVLQF